MFETAMIEPRAARGAIGFSGSMLLQSVTVAGLVVASFWMPVSLPEAPRIPVPALRLPKAVRVVSTVIERSAAGARRKVFTYVPPSNQIVKAAVAVERGMAELLDGLPVLTGTAGTGVTEGIVGSMEVRLPPPAEPKKPEKVAPVVALERLVVGGDVMSSRLIQQVKPVYPEIARRARIEGVVQLRGVITREGRIAQLKVLSGHPMLVKAALEAVSQWVYSPTLLNQRPVEVEAPIEVRFILGR